MLLKQQKYEEASRYGDSVCYHAVTNNEDWIWEQCKKFDMIGSNSCVYGNLAILIYYGNNFPERKARVEELKHLFIKTFC